MPLILICTLLTAVLSGGPAAGTGAAARPEHATYPSHSSQTGATQIGLATRPGLATQPGPHDVGDQPRPRFSWPLPGSPTVVRPFHPPAFRYGPGHRGVDLAAVPGAPVLAAGAGTVVFAGTVAGHGVVSVDHPGGLRTTYEPVTPTVGAGDLVARGERIGTVEPGHPGCPVTVCLHWGVFRWGVFRWGVARGSEHDGSEHDREYLDPLRLLAATRVRLLPIDGTPVVNQRKRPASCSGAGAQPWCAAGIPETP